METARAFEVEGVMAGVVATFEEEGDGSMGGVAKFEDEGNGSMGGVVEFEDEGGVSIIVEGVVSFAISAFVSIIRMVRSCASSISFSMSST